MTRVQAGILLILAGPLLVAFQLALIALDAPRGVMIPVALAAWLGGPILVVTGAAMLWSRGRWTVQPSTSAGRAALLLAGAFVALFLLFWVLVAAEAGPDRADEPFDNLYLAIPLVLAGVCGAVAGIVAAWGMLFRRERSVLVAGVLGLGLVVTVFAAGEIGGHDEPQPRRASPSGVASPAAPSSNGANSHTNARAVDVPGGGVRVSFDYEYGGDPVGATISAITVTPLGDGGKALTGADPSVTPISRGSGHLDVTFALSPDQVSRLRGFSVCFTAPGRPDLGCATAGYPPN